MRPRLVLFSLLTALILFFYIIQSLSFLHWRFYESINFSGLLELPIRTTTYNDVVYQQHVHEKTETTEGNINDSNGRAVSDETLHNDKSQIRLYDIDSNEIAKSPRIVIGIPTIFRSKEDIKFLRYTLSHLLNGMNSEEKRRHLIIVGIADKDNFRRRILTEQLHTFFQQEVESGLIELVSIPVDYYPRDLVMNPCKLSLQNYADTLSRVIARSKRVIDNVYLMQYATKKGGDWYLALRHDTPPIVSGWSSLLTQIVQNAFDRLENGWFMIRFFHPSKTHFDETQKVSLTSISIDDKFSQSFGLLYHITSIPQMVEWLYANYDQMPLEWLIGRYVSEVAKGKVFQGPSLFFPLRSTCPSRVKDKKMEIRDDRYNIRDWEQCKVLL